MPEIRPQPGPQEAFLASPADWVVYGGAAGGGKTFGLILETLRHTPSVVGFESVILRRTLADAKKPGATIDECNKVYTLLGAKPRSDPICWRFPNGGTTTIGHLEHESDTLTWQSSQIGLLGFDELTHFTRSQFFYMTSRARTMARDKHGRPIRPYVRATCNPDADSWVAEFIAWWWDQETGYPIRERSGVLRWLVRRDDELLWAHSREEAVERYGVKGLAADDPGQAKPKSVTFIPADAYDNRIMLEANPDYIGTLEALPLVERERLLRGNWKIRPAAGLLFNRAWCETVDAVPSKVVRIRYWDLAATEKTHHNDPDWTVGVKMAWDREAGIFYIEDVIRMRASPMKVESAVLNTASADGRSVIVGMAQDPGQAGKSLAESFVRKLAGYHVKTQRESGDKVTRFMPFSAQCQAKNVKILRGSWNDAFKSSLEGFPDAAHDDDADACAGAFGMLTLGRSNKVVIRDLVL